jgi:kynurenine formamidase
MESERRRSLAWTPPTYTVDDDGKVAGAGNSNSPNNWGRWGNLDERGTANLISAEDIVKAGRLIVTGEVISCALPLGADSPVHSSRTPIIHLFSYTGTDMVSGSRMARRFPGYQGSDDYLVTPVQGSTHWDGLAHVGADDMMYNGFWMGTVEAQAGAKRCGIQNLHSSLVGRGVLLDLVRCQDVERLEPGYAIEPALLDVCAESEGVEIQKGDIVLIRTGHLPWFYRLRDRTAFWAAGAPGLGMACADWVASRDIAALAMDNIGIEVEPFPDGSSIYPLHVRLVRDLGLTLGEMWWLEDLADACAADRRYAFFLSASPLRISHGVGSMLNPVAIR